MLESRSPLRDPLLVVFSLYERLRGCSTDLTIVREESESELAAELPGLAAGEVVGRLGLVERSQHAVYSILRSLDRRDPLARHS